MSKFPTPYKWMPKNTTKYVGNINDIWVRSSWEKKAMLWFDEQPNILKWGSETFNIKYVSPIDNREHSYYPDFIVQTKSKEGKLVNMVVEVKPAIQCEPPKSTKKTKRMITEMKTFAVNSAKWAAAREFCKRNNMTFIIVDEYTLGLKVKK